MEKEAIEIATPKSAINTAKKRHSLGRAKNLEKEVKLMLVEDHSHTEKMIAEPESNLNDIQLLMTPKSCKRTVKETTLLQTPKSVAIAQAEQLQTPRRSVRKSIKPVQEYDDIVAKKSLRSSKKAEKQSSVEEETENEEGRKKEAPKWTPAKVGRVSQKRKSRKSRKTIVKKRQEDGEHRIQVDVDVLEVIANNEDENKENVEPQELLRNRKSPKDDNKGEKTGSSQETCVSLLPEQEKSKIKCADAQSQPLNSLTLEEVHSPKASHVDSKYIKKNNQQTESRELLDFGLIPIELLEEPLLPLTISDKQQDEEKENAVSMEEIKADAEEKVEEVSTLIPLILENKLGTIIIGDVLPHDQPGNIVPKSVENKEAGNSTFNSSNCGITPEGQTQSYHISDKEAAVKDGKENFNTPNLKESNNANSTFNSSDCIVISPEVEQLEPMLVKESNTLAMCNNATNINTSIPSLLISDDEEQKDSDEKCNDSQSPVKIPKIFVNNLELVSAPQKQNATKVNVVAPFVASSGTPKMSKKKPYRFPTPYKSRVPQSYNFDLINKQEETECNTEDDIKSAVIPPVVFKLTTMEPKEIVLRSIRKRSLSACNDQPQRKQFNRVTFNSPANQTTVIEEIDLLIAKSAKKNVRRMRDEQMDSLISDTNVTKRRKRSLSADESLSMARLNIVQKAPLTPSKLTSTPQKLQLRTKIPNFAAIHQRHFKKMENIVDHVTRKAERAKVLITSASKPRGMSAQKAAFSSNNQNIEPSSSVESSAAVVATVTTHARVGKPKALKKIDLSNNAMKSALPIVAAQKSDNDDDSSNNTAINLPNPQLAKNIFIVQSMPSGTKLQEMQPKKILKPAHPIQMQQAKPAFNLSTNVKKQTANISILDRTATTSATSSSFRKQPSCVNTTIKTTESLPDKAATRRQRHMDMYKGRGGVKSSTDKTSRDKEKSIEIIRGVRSNRRFDLQMQHRKNLNQDHI